MLEQPDIRPINDHAWIAPLYRLERGYLIPDDIQEALEEAAEERLGRPLDHHEIVMLSRVEGGFELDGSTEWVATTILWSLVAACGAFMPSGAMVAALVLLAQVAILALGIRADGRHRAAAVVHDWLYEECLDLCGRAAADRAFLGMMALASMPNAHRYIRWFGVRVFGAIVRPHHAFT